MNPIEFLSGIPNHGEFSRTSKILLFAYYLRKFNGQSEFSSTNLRDCFSGALIRIPSDLASMLRTLSTGRTSPLIGTGKANHYALSIHGLHEVESILPSGLKTSVSSTPFSGVALDYLKKVLAKVPDGQRKDFLAEAISCLGVEARRGTIIMTWLVVLDHLFEYIIPHHLVAFNTALHGRTDAASRITVSVRDDFADIKESVFIEVLRSAGIVTADIRKILDEKLGFRNSCAHPSTIAISEAKVVSFIEDLVDNVLIKLPI